MKSQNSMIESEETLTDQLAAESAAHYEPAQEQLFKAPIRLADIDPRNFKEFSKEEFADKMAYLTHQGFLIKKNSTGFGCLALSRL